MDRTVYIEIGDKAYPMRFSLGAAKKLCEKYGSLTKMTDKITGDGTADNMGAALETVTWIIDLLIKQGCAYKNLFEADIPAPANAPVVDGKYTPPTPEILDTGLGIWEMRELQEKIFQTLGAGNRREVEAEVKPNKTKKKE